MPSSINMDRSPWLGNHMSLGDGYLIVVLNHHGFKLPSRYSYFHL